MKKLFILFAAIAVGLTLEADVMYWQLGTPDSDRYNGKIWNTVRVGVTTGTQTPIMSGDGYLSLTPVTNPDENSASTMIGATSAANGYFAVLPSSDASAYSYFIELGNFNGSTYTALAQSSAITYSELSQSHVITTAQLDDILGHMSSATVQAWVGVNYQAVPEPTGGLMVLVGLSVLALRRRKARV